MVHPVIDEIFSGDDAAAFFVRASETVEMKRLLQFVGWHIEVVSETIDGMEEAARVDLTDGEQSKKWASEFLRGYDNVIRGMRKKSSLIFERFHEIDEEMAAAIPRGDAYEAEAARIMGVFLNGRHLLVGRFIFAYRELWFVAKSITDPGFKAGSVGAYRGWCEDNYPNLRSSRVVLQKIYKAILQGERNRDKAGYG